MLEAIMTMLYLVVCGLWGIFSVNMQFTMYPKNTSSMKVYGVFFLNAILCPISMMIALVRFETYMSKIKKDAVNKHVIRKVECL